MRPLLISLVAATLSLPAWATESDRFHSWLDAQWEQTL